MPDPKRTELNATAMSLARIAKLEEYIRTDVDKDQGEAVALALCEVARQLTRIADLLPKSGWGADEDPE